MEHIIRRIELPKKLTQLVYDGRKNITILEPSCGNGVFINALKNSENSSYCDIEAIEINPEAAATLNERMKDATNVTVKNEDFFDFYRTEGIQRKYDLIIGNPPYIRYQYLEPNQRLELSEILSSNGMKENKLINAWVAFTVACVGMLNENGCIAFVIPAEVLQVAYAEDLRLYLANNLQNITLVTFEELVFPDIEQEVVLLIGNKGGTNTGIRIVEVKDIEAFEDLLLDDIKFQDIGHVKEKWTKYFTSYEDNLLISSIRNDNRFCKLSDLALINVGVTTGNNAYFSLDKATIDEYELEAVSIPLIGRSSHANSVFFEPADWMENVDAAKKCYLLNFPEIPFEEYPEKHQAYIKKGEEEEQNVGYKLRIRDRWYRIPSIWIPDAFFLRRNNLYPKFVLNNCGAISTDTMHRIKFNEGVDPVRTALSYYNSISMAFTEICGRSYGGGVLEILPGETGNIMVPLLNSVPEKVVSNTIRYVDDIVREDRDIEDALDFVDKEILQKYLGISEATCTQFRKIWKKLQHRRLGRGKK